MKELLLISSSFPIYSEEPFLEKEYPFLKKKFDKITFIVVTSAASLETRAITFDSHEVLEMKVNTSGKFQLLLSGICTKLFWSEVKYILSNIPMRYFFSSLKVALVSLENAKLIRRVLERKLATSASTSTVIYSYWGDDGAIAAAQLADHDKVDKVVTRVHGWDVYFGVNSPPYLPFRTYLQKKCRGIYPISEKGKFTIEKVWNVPISNVVTSRLGVDRQATLVKDRDGVFTLVSCSNLIPLKRVQLIAEAVLLLNRKIKWVHFGAGPEFESVSAFVEQSKKQQHEVVFLGNVENAEVLDFYRNNRVDVFINASTSEGIPFSIMEAISFGIPIFATNVGGNSEIVDESNGVLLPENPSAQEIAHQLERFMDLDAESYQYFATGSYKKWENDFNAEQNFTRFVDTISE